MGSVTPAEAQRFHNDAEARGTWLMWFVSTTHPDYPGKAVAWAVAADPSGGTRVPGGLVANTLDELRALLPPGLTRRDRTSVMPVMVLETWD